MVLIVRSILFNIAFVLVTLVEMILFAPFYFLLPHRYVWLVPKFWARSSLFLLKYIAGMDIKIKGLENLEKIKQMSKSYILALKHQSAWETFAILPYLDDPAYVLKGELMWIPFFGWYMAKTGVIAINRGAPIKSLKQIIAQAKEKVKNNRQILIFPEGTRRPVKAQPEYKIGIITLYKELNIPVLPIAHNAGLYWPRCDFRKYSGVVEVEILPPIKPGLAKDEFLNRLVSSIENSCAQLLLQAEQRHEGAPLKLN